MFEILKIKKQRGEGIPQRRGGAEGEIRKETREGFEQP